MESFDWTVSITPNIIGLKIVGLWPPGKAYKLDLYSFFAAVAGVVIIGGHNLSQIIYICYVYTDMKELIATIFVASTNFLGFIKTFFFVKNLRMIKEFLVVLNNEEFKPKNEEQVEMVQKSLDFWRFLYFWYNTVVYSIVLLWCVVPVVNGFDGLPFPAWYPFEVNTTRNYVGAYVYQLFCIWPITTVNLNLDTITLALMMYIWSQCDLLCDNLRTLPKNQCFLKELITCIKHHRRILRFAENCNNFFNMIVFGQITTSSAVLALTMFQLTQVDVLSSEGLNHLLYISGLIMQIFLYCWFGNEVEVKSGQILYAIFESEWSNQRPEVRKVLLIFCVECQKSIVITAVKLFPLSLKTFISVLRSAWSYFALLHTVGTTQDLHK